MAQILPVSGLPPATQYSKETWEATVERDYFDHLAESGAHLLDEALKHKEQVGEDRRSARLGGLMAGGSHQLGFCVVGSDGGQAITKRGQVLDRGRLVARGRHPPRQVGAACPPTGQGRSGSSRHSCCVVPGQRAQGARAEEPGAGVHAPGAAQGPADAGPAPPQLHRCLRPREEQHHHLVRQGCGSRLEDLGYDTVSNRPLHRSLCVSVFSCSCCLLDCCVRFLASWAAFLSRPDAQKEPDYEKVKSIYQTVTKSQIRRE